MLWLPLPFLDYMMPTQKELKDLYTVVSYYLNVDDITEVKVSIGGEDVAL